MDGRFAIRWWGGIRDDSFISGSFFPWFGGIVFLLFLFSPIIQSTCIAQAGHSESENMVISVGRCYSRNLSVRSSSPFWCVCSPTHRARATSGPSIRPPGGFLDRTKLDMCPCVSWPFKWGIHEVPTAYLFITYFTVSFPLWIQRG